MVQMADFDAIRQMAFGAITNAYTVLGPEAADRIRGVAFINDTDGNLMVTNDITKDKIFLKAGSYQVWDVQTNMNPKIDDAYILPIRTQFWVKYITAPSTGNVYIQCLTEP